MKKKKDILFLCQFFYPEYISSAQLPFDTATALHAQGFTVDAMCGYPKEYLHGRDIPMREQVQGVSIRRLRYLQLNRSGFLGRIVNYFSFTAMVLLHLPELARYRCVVVYSNPPILPWIAAWAKKLFGTKLVFVSYDLYPEVATVTGTLGEKHPICSLMRHINQVVFRQADRVVALSAQMKQYIAASRPTAEERIAVIPNWHPDREAAPAGDNPIRELTGGRFTVSYFGNMGTMQDMQTILDAMRLLKADEHIFFLFAGHGNKLEALKKTVREEGIPNTAIFDFLHGQDFQNALDASSCALVSLAPGAAQLCVPSKTYCYMMEGLPLLAIMDDSGIVEDIRAGAGVWVKNGEGARLAAAIRDLAANPEKTAQMGRTSRALYERKYTMDICTGQYADLFRELLAAAEEERV